MRRAIVLLVALCGCKDKEAIALFQKGEPAIRATYRKLETIQKLLPARGAERESCTATVKVPDSELPLFDEELFKTISECKKAIDEPWVGNDAVARSKSELVFTPCKLWFEKTRDDPDYGEGSSVRATGDKLSQPLGLLAVLRTTEWDRGEANWKEHLIVRPAKWVGWVFLVEADDMKLLATAHAHAATTKDIEAKVFGRVPKLLEFLPIESEVSEAVKRVCAPKAPSPEPQGAQKP
jgi:hypothetical protein